MSIKTNWLFMNRRPAVRPKSYLSIVEFEDGFSLSWYLPRLPQYQEVLHILDPFLPPQYLLICLSISPISKVLHAGADGMAVECVSRRWSAQSTLAEPPPPTPLYQGNLSAHL